MNFHLAVLFLFVIGIQFKSIECGKKMDLDGLKDMLKPMSKSCKTKTGIAEELLDGMKNGLFPPERTLMCYLKCLSIMLKLMNKKGEFSFRDVAKQIDLLVLEEIAVRMKAILKSCLDSVTPSDDTCEFAYNIVVCGYKKDPSLNFLPT